VTAIAPPIPAAAPAAPDPVHSPLQIESLVAAIGIEPFVSHTLTKVHGHHAARADKMADEIARKIHLFINRAERAPSAPLPAFNFKRVVSDLDAPVHPDHVEAEIRAFGGAGDLAVQANLVVQRIRAYVQQAIPRRVYMGLQGPEPGEPARSDVARFRRLWVIACDPLSILDDLNEYAVSRDQVKACSEMFPLVWGTFRPIMQAQFVRRAGASGGTYRLPRRKEGILRVLTKQEEPTYPLVRALQAVFAAEAAAMAPQSSAPAPAIKKDAADESTASQRIAD
jgi:hypothetical protein